MGLEAVASDERDGFFERVVKGESLKKHRATEIPEAALAGFQAVIRIAKAAIEDGVDPSARDDGADIRDGKAEHCRRPSRRDRVGQVPQMHGEIFANLLVRQAVE